MANYNKVLLIGNLTRDPELRYLQSGTAVCDFGMAVNRQWRSQSGEKKDEVCFVDITFFGRSAEVISEFCKKGRSLFVEGRLQLDSWTGKDGQKRSKLRVVGERMQFLDARGGGGAPGPAAPAAPGRTEPADQSQARQEEELGVDDDSIPF